MRRTEEDSRETTEWRDCLRGGRGRAASSGQPVAAIVTLALPPRVGRALGYFWSITPPSSSKSLWRSSEKVSSYCCTRSHAHPGKLSRPWPSHRRKFTSVCRSDRKSVV